MESVLRDGEEDLQYSPVTSPRRPIRIRSSDEEKQSLKQAFLPVVQSSLLFCCFVAMGTLFFTLYPGEGKTLGQGIYMSLITLSTVGFGAFTPSTHAGMVFAAYWMILGCFSMVSVVTSRIAFSMALKEHELRMMKRYEAINFEPSV